MPPVLSHFQAMMRIIISTNDGIRFIIKEPTFCQKLFSGEKESRANKLIKKIESIIRIRGSQRRTGDFISSIFTEKASYEIFIFCERSDISIKI
jgi:hypothetical protein